jgi:hypothetical protein
LPTIKGCKFPTKLWSLVNNPSAGAVKWASTGESIVISSSNFEQTLRVAKIFKSASLATFIRQLNMYGFRKVASLNEHNLSIFQHPSFLRGKPDLVKFVQRSFQKKAPTTAPASPAPSSPSLFEPAKRAVVRKKVQKVEQRRLKNNPNVKNVRTPTYSEGTISSEGEDVMESEDDHLLIARVQASEPSPHHFIPTPDELLRNRVFDAVLNDLEREIWENRRKERLEVRKKNKTSSA